MSEQRFRGKTVVVTGASRGIGRATALKFAEEGAQVAVLARSPDALTELCDEVHRLSAGRCLAVPTDVASEDEVQAAVERVLAELGPVDVLVNNAGIFAHRPFAETTCEDFLRLFRTNTLGAFLLCRLIVPGMIERGRGRIINIASTAARKGYKHQSAYCASKHALMGLSKALALELRGTGVSVHVINPGGVNTDLVRQARTDVNFSEYMAPEEVADVVLFVAAMEGLAALDEVVIRRTGAQPWGY